MHDARGRAAPEGRVHILAIAAEGMIYSRKPRDSSSVLGASCLGNVLLRRHNDVKRLITIVLARF